MLQQNIRPHDKAIASMAVIILTIYKMLGFSWHLDLTCSYTLRFPKHNSFVASLWDLTGCMC